MGRTRFCGFVVLVYGFVGGVGGLGGRGFGVGDVDGWMLGDVVWVGRRWMGRRGGWMRWRLRWRLVGRV